MTKSKEAKSCTTPYWIKSLIRSIAKQILQTHFIYNNCTISKCFWKIVIQYQLRKKNPQTLLKLLIKGKGICLQSRYPGIQFHRTLHQLSPGTATHSFTVSFSSGEFTGNRLLLQPFTQYQFSFHLVPIKAGWTGGVDSKLAHSFYT